MGLVEQYSQKEQHSQREQQRGKRCRHVLTYSLYGKNRSISGSIKLAIVILPENERSIYSSQFSVSSSRFGSQRKVFCSEPTFKTYFPPVVSAVVSVRSLEDVGQLG